MASNLTLQNCSNEGDLAQIAQAILDEAAKVRDEILSQVNELTSATVAEAVDEANKKYDTAIAPNNSDEVSEQIGLPKKDPSPSEDEARLEPLGLVMVRGIIYASGVVEDNIERFRKLFFAVGSNVDLFLSLVKSSENLIVVQTRLIIRRLPMTGKAWTLGEARDLFKNDAIEKLYQAGDGAYYAITPQFLAVNKSVKQTALEVNVPENEIVTQVFWLREIEQTSARINQLISLGVGADERTSILNNQPLKDVRPTVVADLRTNMDRSVGKALDQMQLLNTRFSQVPVPVRESFRSEILTSLNEGRGILLELERKVRFSPVFISRPEDIEDFLKKNKTEDLPYLFSQRRTVKAINFQINASELAALIQSAALIPAGSNTVSSVLSNQPPILLDYDVDSTNESWALNECGRLSLLKQGDLMWGDLSAAYLCVSSIRTRPVIPTPSNVPVIGYDSQDSPSSIMFRRANLVLTLDIPNLFEKILELAKPLTDVVREGIRVFIAMIKAMRSAVDAVLKPLIEEVKGVVAKIEAFLSRHLSYFATAGIDSSILKCALNLDLRTTLPFLSDIAPFLETLSRQLQNLISKIALIMSAFLDRLLCLPLNFLNDLLKGSTSFLPPFCRTESFKMPADLEAALAELRQSFQIEQAVYRNFSQNLFRLDVAIATAPSQIDSFRESLVCNQSPLNSRFMDIFKKGFGVGTNPLGAVAGRLNQMGSSPLSRGAQLIPPRG